MNENSILLGFAEQALSEYAAYVEATTKAAMQRNWIAQDVTLKTGYRMGVRAIGASSDFYLGQVVGEVYNEYARDIGIQKWSRVDRTHQVKAEEALAHRLHLKKEA